MAGLIRGLDHQRRLVIPKEVLNAAHITPGDEVEMWLGHTEDGKPAIMLQKWGLDKDRCPTCGFPQG